MLITYFGISFQMVGQNLDVYLGRVLVCPMKSFVYASVCELNTTIYLLDLYWFLKNIPDGNFQLICSPSRNVCCSCKRLELVLKSPHTIMTAKSFWKVESHLLANLWYIHSTKRHFNSISHLSAYSHYATEKLHDSTWIFVKGVYPVHLKSFHFLLEPFTTNQGKNVQENEVHYNQVKH